MMKIRMNKDGKRMIYSGIDKSTFFWFDLKEFFSIDIGKWFIRIFFQIKDYNFCKYLGDICYE